MVCGFGQLRPGVEKSAGHTSAGVVLLAEARGLGAIDFDAVVSMLMQVLQRLHGREFIKITHMEAGGGNPHSPVAFSLCPEGPDVDPNFSTPSLCSTLVPSNYGDLPII